MHPHPDEPRIHLDRDGGSRDDVVEFGPGPRRPARWRRWALPAVVAIALAVAAFAVARSGHGGPSAAPSPSVVASTFATDAATASPLASSDGSPVTVKVGHPLLGVTAGWELFGHSGLEVVRIQLAAGLITRTQVPTVGTNGPISFLVTPDNAVVRPLDAVVGYRVPDGGRAVPLVGALTLNGPALPGPRAGTMWVPADSNAGGSRLELVDVNGAVVGPVLGPPDGFNGYPLADGSGNLLLSGTGGVYRLDPSGIQRVSTGSLIAVGPTRWLMEECDQAARCSPVVIDKSTGAKHQLARANLPTSYLQGTIAPDGHTAALYVTDNGPTQVALYNLDTGALRPLTVDFDQRYDGTAVWSPDSKWVFVTDNNGVIKAIDAGTGKITDLGVALPNIDALAVRPAPSP